MPVYTEKFGEGANNFESLVNAECEDTLTRLLKDLQPTLNWLKDFFKINLFKLISFAENIVLCFIVRLSAFWPG